jgi:hypothetical protein
MHKHKLRFGVVRAAAVGAAALSAALIVGGGVASAAVPADPQGGATPVAPHFYNGNVEGIRDSGSDTTFFMMQKIGDLYTGAGLYGCTLNNTAGQTLYNSSDPAATTTNENYFCQSGQNVSTTDTSDNWDRTEITGGVDLVGSGGGQNQLCGAASTPLTVDFARSSKPAGTACTGLVGTGYAKDGVDLISYPVNPTQIGGGVATTAPYSTLNGGVIGPVGSGWLPGDANTGPFTGTSLTSGTGITNVGGAASTAYELWCATDSTRISDWGQLTNLGPNIAVPNASVTSGSNQVTLAAAPYSAIAIGQAITGPDIPASTTITGISGNVLTISNNASATKSNEDPRVNVGSTAAIGAGAPIGVPVRIMGVNSASGTEATWASYAEAGVSSGGCASNMNTNAASDPNPVTATGDNAGTHIALENNSDQINQFAVTDFPGDNVSQGIESATTLYIESDGVYNTNPYAAATTVAGVKYSGSKVALNGKLPTTTTKLGNTYPTARTLFNIYLTSSIRASAGGFLNWICDGNTNFSKSLDNSTGINFDTELTNQIGTVFGFPRLTDTTGAPAIGTPADGLAAPNNSCAASLAVNTTSGSNTITLASGNFPADIVNAGGLVGGGSVTVTGAGIPAGTTVVSGAGTSTLTLSAAATATATGVGAVFGGVPAVTSVASSQN